MPKVIENKLFEEFKERTVSEIKKLPKWKPFLTFNKINLLLKYSSHHLTLILRYLFILDLSSNLHSIAVSLLSHR